MECWGEVYRRSLYIRDTQVRSQSCVTIFPMEAPESNVSNNYLLFPLWFTGKYLTTVDNISMKMIEGFKELFMQKYILRCLVEHWKWFQICGVPQVWRWRLRQRKQISCLSPPSLVKLPKTQRYFEGIMYNYIHTTHTHYSHPHCSKLMDIKNSIL